MNYKEQIEVLKNLTDVCNLLHILDNPEKNGINIDKEDLKDARNVSQYLFRKLLRYYIKDERLSR